MSTDFGFYRVKEEFLFSNIGLIGRYGPNQAQLDAQYSNTNLANKEGPRIAL